MKVEFLEEHVIPGKRLGRHIVHDPRSRDYPVTEVLRSTTAQKPDRGWYRRSVWDQGSTSRCTVEATAGQLRTQPYTEIVKQRARKELDKHEVRHQAYLRAQHLDPWPGGEAPQSPVYYGSSGIAACKALIEAGLVPEGWQYRWAFGVDEALRALDVASISVGTYWPEGFDRPDEHGRVKLEGQMRGGHQWEVIDHDDEYVRAVNSWGRGYAKNGRFLVSITDFASLLEQDGDVVVWTPA